VKRKVRLNAPRRTRSVPRSPQKIIAENTDWRFINELKRELKT
jgi:hypothetical protein